MHIIFMLHFFEGFGRKVFSSKVFTVFLRRQFGRIRFIARYQQNERFEKDVLPHDG